MGDPLVIQRSLDHLHPVVRSAVKKVRDQLNKEGHSFEVFESFRTPQRQAFLYAQGRTRPGSKVTKAPPWSSYHQYGLAVDFVLKVNGNWSWETKGKFAKGWQRLHALGDKLGLEPLSWELPHLQYKGVTINQLRSGDFPDGGDGAWRDHLVAVTAAWNGPQAPPPLPPEFVGKAAIVDGDDPEAGEAPDESPGLQDNGDGADAGGAGTSPASSDPELARPATPGESGMSDAIGENNFGKVQPIVDKWEGGYVDHPADPGGATNMGITLATLSRWRGRVVSKAEVKALTRAEAWKIMKRYYYDVVRGDDLPLPVACAAHNAAVLSGPSRSAKFLQTALRSLGKGVSVDGAIGPQSLSAVSECDPFQLANAFFQVQENYLRSLKHFTVFGKGWLNRLADVRTYASKLIDETQAPEEGELVSAANSGVNSTVTTGSSIVAPEVNNLLTPVNAALGETMGNALNGRKTAIGAIGLLATSLTQQYAGGSGADVPGIVQTVTSIQPYAQPILAALLGWGLLGKLEKWNLGRPFGRQR